MASSPEKVDLQAPLSPAQKFKQEQKASSPVSKPKDPWDMHDMGHNLHQRRSSEPATRKQHERAAPNDAEARGYVDPERPLTHPSARDGKIWIPGMGWQEKIQPAAEPGYGEFDDFDPGNYDPPDIGKGETYIKDDKILRMKDGSIYVGQTDYSKRPHGHGHLMLADGSQHIGYFEEGRAMGAGLAQLRNGTCAEGEWRDNRRYGRFQVVDANGVNWTEKYDVEGKKVARKKVKRSVPNPEYVEGGQAPVTIEVPEDPGKPAQECWTCQGLFHDKYNNDY